MLSENTVIQIQNVSKTYKLGDVFYALQDINLTIEKTDSIGLVGVNGSGKSTLLKLIAGNLKPSEGSIEVKGKVVILDYSSGFNGQLTGEENIYIKGMILGFSKKELDERFQKIVEFSGLGDFIYQPLKTYSSGMVARLGFSIIAYSNADIIIADEALAVGDMSFVNKCMDFIHSFLNKGTFIFVSHSMSDIRRFCRKAILLDKGKIIAQGSSEYISSLYLGQKFNEKLNNRIGFEDNKLQSVIELSIPELDKNVPIYNHFFVKELLEKPQILRHDKNFIEWESAGFETKKDGLITQFIGGEELIFKVEFRVKEQVNNIIMFLKMYDRLGQVILGLDNYSQNYNKKIIYEPGQNFILKKKFIMPFFPQGAYVGEVLLGYYQAQESVIHLFDEAFRFSIQCITKGARHGLIGLPLVSIEMRCLRKIEEPVLC